MSEFGKKKFSTLQVVALLTVAFLGVVTVSYAVTLNTFTAGSTISSSQVNQNFTNLNNALPAAKSATPVTLVSLTGTLANILSLTVTPPANGYIVVTAEGNAEVDGTTVASQDEIFLTNVSAGSDDINYRAYIGVSDAPTYTLFPFSITRVFTASAGVPQTFYMTGYESVGSTTHNSYVRNPRMMAIFIPALLP